MNRLVWVMLVFLVVCTIAIGLISCGTKNRTEPNEPAISDGTQDDEPLIFEDDEEEEEEPEDEEEEEESKPSVPVINPPASSGSNSWTPPSYIPPASVVTPPQDTDTADKNVVYSKAGTYSTPAIYQDVAIESKGVILSNKTVGGDLVITEDVGTGDVYLTNVVIDGTLYVYGGGENSIYLDDVTVNKIVVDKGRRGRVRLVASGKTEVKLVEAYSGVILKETGMNRNFEGFIDITTKPGNNLSSVQITLYGCDIDEIYALEETTLSIRSGCEIGLVNASKENITVNGEWDAIDTKKGDVDRGSSGSSGGGGGSSSKDRIPAPKNLDYTSSDGRILVTWNSVSKADDYTVKVNGKTKDVKYYDYLGTDITDMVPEGKNDLEVEVRANRSSSSYKDSYYSSTLRIKNVVKAKPAAGAVLSYDSASSTLQVKWQPLGDSYTDHLEVAILNKANNDVVFSNSNVPTANTEVSFPLTSTTRGITTYIAKITSVPKASGTEIGIAPEPVIASGEYTHEVKAKLPAPANLQVSYNDITGKASLKWDAVLGAVSYEVYKKADAGTEVLAAAVTAANTEISLTEEERRSAVSFTVKAKDTDPQYTSDASAECILSKLAAPVISSAEFADGSVTLKWSAVPDAASYEVQMDDKAVPAANITFSGTTAVIKNVSAEKHAFAVRAKSSKAIPSDYSSPKELDTLSKPAGLTLSYDEAASAATLTWTAVDGALGYEVLLDSVAPASVTPPVQGTTVTIQNVSSGSHTFRVRAVSAGKIPSEYSEAMLTKLAAPEGVQFDGSSQITWKAVTNAASYQIYKDGAAYAAVSAPAISYEVTESGQYAIAAVGANASVISSEKSASVPVTVQTASSLAAPQVTLEQDGENFRLNISAPGASGVTVYDGSRSLIVTGSAPSFAAEIPAAEATYIVKAMGSATLFTTDSPETRVSIEVRDNTPSLTLGQDGILRASGRNLELSLNGTVSNATSADLKSQPAGDYTAAASTKTFAEGCQIFKGGTVQQTYTVRDAVNPTVKPVLTKSGDTDSYTVAFFRDAAYSYQYRATLSYTDQRAPTTKDLIVTADGKISAVQIQQPGDPIVSSFTVTVTAIPVNALAVSGNAVTRYAGYTLTSEPFTIPAQAPPNSQEPAPSEQPEPEAADSAGNPSPENS